MPKFFSDLSARSLTYSFVTLTLAGFFGGSAFGQNLSGYHEYPQFRTMSGLPGSSFPVNAKGEIDPDGAIALSTPVAYSLGRSRFVLGAMTVSFGSNFQLINRRGDDLVKGNGTAQGLGGFSLGRYGSLTVGGMLLSGILDTTLNLHWAPPQFPEGGFTYAVGVQDVFGQGGASGVRQPGDGDSSTSLYLVATKEVARETHVSLGYGTRRFGRPFGNVSTTVAPGFKVYAEYDAFNFNLGLGYFVPLGESGDHRSAITLNVGLVRAKYPSLSANLSF
ncbi:hypothetical protein BH11ARM2_BH11ARM2_06880 [soil metagenome]